MRAVASGRCDQPHDSKEAVLMATYLYRLGGWAFENRRKVLLAWLLLLGVVGFCALTFSGRTSEKFDVPGTESQEAQKLLEHKFPEASGAYARVVYEAPAGEKLTDPENQDAIRASVTMRSEEHTSELQSLRHLVCRLLLEKKKKKTKQAPG